jgi:hypothetical protein
MRNAVAIDHFQVPFPGGSFEFLDGWHLEVFL